MIISSIKDERKRQIKKWGNVYHSPIEYVALLAEELGEVSRHAHQLHWNGKYYDVNEMEEIWELRKEIVQVAALCVAFLESIE